MKYLYTKPIQRNSDIRLKKSRNYKVLVWMSVGLLILLQIYFAVQTATRGAELANLEIQQSKLAKANQGLAEQLVESSSLTKIQNQADSLGYVPSQKRIFIGGKDFFAKLP